MAVFREASMPYVLIFLLAALSLFIGRRRRWNPWVAGAALSMALVLFGHMQHILALEDRIEAVKDALAVSAGPVLLAMTLEIKEWRREAYWPEALAGLGHLLLAALAGFLVSWWLLPPNTLASVSALFLLGFGLLAPGPRSDAGRSPRMGGWLAGLAVLLALSLAPADNLEGPLRPCLTTAGRCMLGLAALALAAAVAHQVRSRLAARWPRIAWLEPFSDLVLAVALPACSSLLLGTAYPGWALAGLAMAGTWPRGGLLVPDLWPKPIQAWRPHLPEWAGTLLAVAAGLAMDPVALGDPAVWILGGAFLLAALVARFFVATRVYREDPEIPWRRVLPSGLAGLALMQIAFAMHSFYPGVRAATFMAWTAMECLRPIRSADA
jgi:hypothetical protein